MSREYSKEYTIELLKALIAVYIWADSGTIRGIPEDLLQEIKRLVREGTPF